MIDLADLDLGAFVYVEGDLERGRGNLADFRLDGGELPAALREVFLQHHRRALHLVGIVLRLDRQPDLPLLEPVEHFRYRDRLHARAVLDGADHAPLGQHEAHDHACLARLRLQADVVEAAGIPQSHEIAVQRVFVEDVALLGEDQRAESVLGDAARATEFDGFDDVAGRGGGRRFRSFRGLELRFLARLLGRRRGWRRGLRHIFERVRFFRFLLRLLRLALIGRWFGRFGLRLRLRPGGDQR